jgi:hypothetical protein
VTGSARDLLTWAARQVGTLEDPKGSNRQPFAAIAGHANALPWCATFLVAGWKANDVPLIAGTNTASTLFMHDAFSDGGRLFHHPRAADVGFKFVASEGRIGHAFFVEKVVGDFVHTIEGNTNLDGSATGIGVFRLSRLWRNGPTTIRGFGRQHYGHGGATPGASHAVSLADVIDAATRDPASGPGVTSHPREVRIVEAALTAEGLLSPSFAKDGRFGAPTITAYSQWQRRRGFSGKDANGIPGKETLKALGQFHGFAVKD